MCDRENFYKNCSDILSIRHEYSLPVSKRNRWNNRKLGNGRFPGFGLIQCFGSFVRVVSKDGTKIFYNYKDVYDYLNEIRALGQDGLSEDSNPS